MTQVMLNLLDSGRSLHARTDEGLADAAMAALAADPWTIAELEAAMPRFRMPPDGGYFRDFQSGVCDESHDAGLVVIDLAARLTACQCSTGEPLLDGAVKYHNGREETDMWMCFTAPPDWMLIQRVPPWRGVSEQRRRKWTAVEPLDTRAVVYGQISEYIVHQLIDRNVVHSKTDETISHIHGDWLLSAHPGLAGRSPREVLLELRTYIDRDLDDQARHWSLLLEPPPGLRQDARAFRFGGYGTHEIIVYYDMVRTLLRDSARRLKSDIAARAEDEIERLKRFQQDWLNSPAEEYDGRTPAQVISRERSRLPWAVFGADKMADCDCPMCQMLAEDPSPSYWAPDSTHMEDEFAFSFSKTRRDWELDGGMSREFSQEALRFDGQQASSQRTFIEALARLPDPVLPPAADRSQSSPWPNSGPWTRSYSDPQAHDGLPKDVALKMKLFGIGAHLSELGQDLKDLATKSHARRGETLRNHFSQLRQAVRDQSWWTVKAVVADFGRELTLTAVKCPKLADKCTDLERQLDEYSAFCGESSDEEEEET